ncbi:MAG: TonB-dependent receptor, partial [Muribaculaceae bacterium]|nr:TonB-dependent receptor [Muribaculaceae bacterium]
NTYYSSMSNSGSNSRWLVSNDCLIFKNLNVNYDLPKNWMKAISLKGMSLGFSVDNLFIATKRKGMNPRYSNSGTQGNYFVASRVYSFELTARF